MKIKIAETGETKELDDVVSFFVTKDGMTMEEFEKWEKVTDELHELFKLIEKYRHRYGDEAINSWYICSDIHVVDPEMILWTAERELHDMDIDYVLSLSSSSDDNDDDD